MLANPSARRSGGPRATGERDFHTVGIGTRAAPAAVECHPEILSLHCCAQSLRIACGEIARPCCREVWRNNYHLQRVGAKSKQVGAFSTRVGSGAPRSGSPLRGTFTGNGCRNSWNPESRGGICAARSQLSQGTPEVHAGQLKSSSP